MKAICSIIIPTYNEEKYIKSCIESILSQRIDKKKIEVFFVDGNSKDKTIEIIKSYQKDNSFIHLLDNPKKYPPSALNIGIRAANGEYIIRLDAHSYYPPNYLDTLLFWSKQLNADNIGAPIRTQPKNKTPKSLSIATVLSHRLGVGNGHFRIGVKEPKVVDTVPFGCYKADSFTKFGLFNEKLHRNQDIEFNQRINEYGGKILLVPNTYLTYASRETYKSFASNSFQNGFWNILTIFITKKFQSLKIRHFIPFIFVLALLSPIFFSIIFSPLYALISIAVFSMYTILVGFYSLKLHQNSTPWFYIFVSFFVLHISYGVGSIFGFLSLPKRILK